MSHLKNIFVIGGILAMSTSFSTSTSVAETADKLSIVNPQSLYDPSAHGYSVSVVAPAGARVAYVSGQGGADDKGAYSPEFSVQVKQAYANLKKVLDALDATPAQVAKLTVYVVDHDPSKLGVLTQNVMEMFGETLPAQTLVPVPKLAIDPMLFEVEAVVILP
ncbi:Endoribonuclease L-PSP [Pseudovibrio sp. Ad5]|uniref:RidA family protein n=1 Tax=Pseudovibrio sp. Ad5 TaxID=989436 RepID=UPI0007AE413D|nr:RidA family protein [Pseudovibrio sp. Ad5]KZK98146.1 Endoribonuclease L-PSP [Pseudovibrio sp. Ad5]